MVIEYSLLECDEAVCHPPGMRIPTITGKKIEMLYFDHCGQYSGVPAVFRWKICLNLFIW